ncbi:unnamed protein product [Polarella glacialis]|uniref:Protein kinase domain-containing protein n=1 Tax=Polarella glacialis TaxID=89957 RepID=A0A813J4M4_POLGL|nr:unnamed protein product [Polarella glacialis]
MLLSCCCCLLLLLLLFLLLLLSLLLLLVVGTRQRYPQVSCSILGCIMEPLSPNLAAISKSLRSQRSLRSNLSSENSCLDEDEPSMWLHPLHLQMQGPVPLGLDGLGAGAVHYNRGQQMTYLARKAADGDFESLVVKQGGDGQCSVQVKKTELVISSIDPDYPDATVKVSLLLAEIICVAVKSAVSLYQQILEGNPAPQYILAVAPRDMSLGRDQGMRSSSSLESWRGGSTSEISSEQKVWLICIGRCDSSQVERLLWRLSARGGIRWDLDELYNLSVKPLDSRECGSVFLGQAIHESMPSKVSVMHLNESNAAQIRLELGFLSFFREHQHIQSIMGCFCSSKAAKDNDNTDAQPRVSSKQLQWSFVSDTAFDTDLCQVLMERGALPQDEALVVICGVLSAISHLHLHQVVHRDVKAAHVLFGPSGKAVLFGLGSAVFCRDPRAMQPRGGSPGYAAPELASGEPGGFEGDVFATGVLLYLILSNTMPLGGGDLRDVLSLTKQCEVKFPFSQVSGGLMVILQAMMEKSPQSRPKARRAFQACWAMLSSAARIQALSSGQICPVQVELHADPNDASSLLQLSSEGSRLGRRRSSLTLPSIKEHLAIKKDVGTVEKQDEKEQPPKMMAPSRSTEQRLQAIMALPTAVPRVQPTPPTTPRGRPSFLRHIFRRFGTADRSK